MVALRMGIKARRAAVTDPHEGALREGALDQVDTGWLDGPFPFDGDGKLVAGAGERPADPACRFGVQQGKKLIPVDDCKRSQANMPTAIRTPVNLPTWDHVAAIISTFQGKGMSGNLAYKQPPARDDHKMLAVVSLKDPASGKMPETALLRNGSCAPFYRVSRGVATAAVRWLGIPRLGRFDDFGLITTELRYRAR